MITVGGINCRYKIVASSVKKRKKKGIKSLFVVQYEKNENITNYFDVPTISRFT